jgi:hypothetical protein
VENTSTFGFRRIDKIKKTGMIIGSYNDGYDLVSKLLTYTKCVTI